MYWCALLKKIATATETYEKLAPHFVRHDMASTLTISFLRHCCKYYISYLIGPTSSAAQEWIITFNQCLLPRIQGQSG